MLTTRPIAYAINEEVERRFREKCAFGEHGCIEWTAAKSPTGYGKFGLPKGITKGIVVVQAHRVAWVIANGEIENGLVIDHLCRNKSCVNVSHLRVVTSAENNYSNPRSGFVLNSAKTHCKHGHEFTELNTYRFPGGGRRCRACHNARSLRDYYDGRSCSAKRTFRGTRSSETTQ